MMRRFLLKKSEIYYAVKIGCIDGVEICIVIKFYVL